MQCAAPRKKAVRFRRLITSLIHRLIQPFSVAAAAFILCFSQLFSIPSPFACCLIIALGAAGESPLPALLGVLAAFGMRLLWQIDPQPWQLVGCLFAAFTRRFYFGRSDRKASLWIGISLLPLLIYTLIFETPAGQLLALATVAMGMVSAPAFCQSVRRLREPGEESTRDDRLCMALGAALLICGLGYLYLFRINLGLFAACLITLCAASLGGNTGAVCGLFGGAALAFCGHGSTPVLLLCASGMAAGLTGRMESRAKAALIFVLTVVLASLADGSQEVLTHGLSSALAGVVFLLIRPSRLERLKSLTAHLLPKRQNEENTYAGEMLKQWESAIGEMAESLPELTEISPDDYASALQRALCADCLYQEECFNGTDGKELMLTLRTAGEDGGDISLCQRPEKLAAALAQAESELETKRLQIGRAKLEQAMIRTHLTALSQAARRLSAAAQGESLEDIRGALEIERVLKQSDFPAHLLYARKPGGHLQCVLEADTPSFTRWQPQRLLSDLWALGGLSMEITQLEKSRLHLEETPAFRLETGTASLAMEEINGDGVLSIRFPGGRHMLALSDGMGHGPSAHRESQQTLDLLRLCLMADYTRAQAITAVNGMMLSATGGDRFATVDLWTIDLWNGLAQVEKLGACQSCLWRNDKPRLIEGAALPLGILENIHVSSQQIRLHDNDLILVFSDGVADAFPNETALNSAIGRCVYQDPQRTADALLRQALIAAGGLPKDDMTVLAARLSLWSASV